MIAFVLKVWCLVFLPLLPSTHDKHGWGLRIHGLSITNPLLAGEAIDHSHFWATLINFSNRTQAHDPLSVAHVSLAFDVIVIAPDGKQIEIFGDQTLRGKRDPLTVQTKLPAGGCSSLDFGFAEFGYWRLAGSGRYRVEAHLNLDAKPNGRTISAPPVEFEVLDAKSEVTLASQKVDESRSLAVACPRFVIQSV